MKTLFRLASALFQAPLLWFSRIWMRLFGCDIASTAKIYGLPMLWQHKGKLSIGERTIIHSMHTLYEFGQEFPGCAFMTKPGASINIGNDSRVIGSVIAAWKSVSIGDRVMIAAGCRITDTDFHPVDRVPRVGLDDLSPKAVTLENDVWLCAEVMVCKGVTIGRGSVIGAKSIVTSDIPPMVLAAGNPARVIRPLAIPEVANH